MQSPTRKVGVRSSAPARVRSALAARALLAALAIPCIARADVSLPSIFSSNMVIQRGKPVPVWGKAAPGEPVTVTFAGQTKEATAGTDGRWSLRLDSLDTSAEPRTMTIAGKNRIELANVLVGQVWVGSGQSNMQWPVRASKDPEAEIKAADFSRIRLFQIPLVHSAEPRDDVKAAWRVCAPDNVAEFSAVLYFFGRELHGELDVPFGLIQTAWGGTRIEPWTPIAGFAQTPALADIHAAAAGSAPGGELYKKEMSGYLDAVTAWAAAARAQVAGGGELPKDSPQPPNLLPSGHQTPVAIYNAMVHPIVPYAIRGAIWYQGESNNGEGMAYFEKMKALIGGWREVWGQGDFPFYFVQIAPFNYGAERNHQLPELWEAQAAALAIPNTGMAVITDVTDLADIHPRDKQTVGKRLALLALSSYGRDVVFSGPVYKDHSAENGKIRIRFQHADGGLESRDGKPLTWFEVAGAEGDFAPAEAVIDGSDVLVSSPAVPKPARVRFAWSQLAEPNLVNKAGLPAVAFRTKRPE